MARPPSANSVLRNMKKQTPEPKTPIASEMFIPNHSGIAVHPEAVNTFVKKTDLLNNAYWQGHQDISSGITYSNMNASTTTWQTRISFDETEAENWTETSGELEYTGNFPASGVRKFLVTYSYLGEFYSSQVWTTCFFRVTKDTGGGHAEVLGSLNGHNPIAYVYVFGVYVMRAIVSGAVIVSIESGDKLALQYGFYNSAASGTYNVGNFATTLIGSPSVDSGINMNITPADTTP